MRKETKEFKKILEKSKDILILTHRGPDFDAFCSALILKEFLNIYYPSKKVTFKAKNIPTNNIPDMQEIKVVDRIEAENEDLVILIDAGNWRMCTDEKDTIASTNAKLVIIDHHESPSDESDLTINDHLSSATEQVLSLFIDIYGKRLKITESIAILGQTGIISDTARFLYSITKPETHEIFAKLKRIYNFDIEDFTNKVTKFPFEAIAPYIVYLENIKIVKDMAYTYISKDDMEKIGATKVGVNAAQSEVRDKVVRQIQGTHWGFVIRPDFDTPNQWYVSFRSTNGYQQVDKIAESLGGGGHQLASAARISASNAQDAVDKVLEKINEVVDLA